MILSRNLSEAFNAQVNAEMWSSNLYLSMSVYFQKAGLNGFAHWMKKQAAEELEHAHKLIDYALDRGGDITIGQINVVPTGWGNPLLGIIKRAKQALNLKRDSELAEYLEVSRATVTNWGARNSIDFRLLLDKFGDKVDYNWLLLGKGNPKHQPRFCQSELVQGEVEIIHNPKTPEPIDDRSVTLYDITAAANLKTLFTNKQQYALGKILIPNISVCDGAVYVNGDSMYPILKSGDIIGYKEISSFDNVIYGEIYLVSFMIDGDEYLAVKYVNRSEKEGYLKLVSYNTHHEPMDIPFASINAMAIVKFSIRRHMMM